MIQRAGYVCKSAFSLLFHSEWEFLAHAGCPWSGVRASHYPAHICTQVGGQSPLSARAARPRAPICPSDEVTLISISHPSFMSHRSLLIQTIVLSSFLDHIHRSGALSQPPLDDFLLFSVTFRRRTLNSTLHPDIFWEMVKFVDLGVLYFSLVLPRGPMWDPLGLQWNLRSLGGFFLLCL